MFLMKCRREFWHLTVAQCCSEEFYICPGMVLSGMRGKHHATKTSKIYCSRVFLVRGKRDIEMNKN